MAAKSKAELAREHLGRARRALTDYDATEAVTWLLASLEAAIVALSEAHGLGTPTQHWKKAQAASKLHSSDVLTEDLSKTIDVLDEARKVAVYEGEEPELDGSSLEELAEQVERVVEVAERERRR